MTDATSDIRANQYWCQQSQSKPPGFPHVHGLCLGFRHTLGHNHGHVRVLPVTDEASDGGNSILVSAMAIQAPLVSPI